MSKHSSDPKKGQLLPLGREVSRIAESLADDAWVGTSPVSEEDICKLLRARRRRHRYFPESLFGEAGWDMLLELLYAEIENRQMSVSKLCEKAGAPAAVVMRWLKHLVDEGLVLRRPDSLNTGSDLVELGPKTKTAFRQYFDDLSKH